MSFVKQLASETAIYGISSILSRIVYFVFLTGYLTRLFTDRTLYAIHQDLYSYMAILLIIFTYRMETAYFRIGSDKDLENNAFYTSFISIVITTILLSSVMLIWRSELAEALQYSNKGVYIIYMLLIISFDALAAIPFARLRLQNKPIKFALIKVANVVFTVIFVIFFLEICPILINRGFSFFENIYHPDRQLDLVIIANIISSALVLILLIPQIIRSRFIFDFSLLRKMAWYVFPLVIVSMAGVFNQYFAVPLLKYLLPGEKNANLDSAAIYAAAAKLALLMNLFTQAFNYAAEPFFFKRAKDENAKETYADVAEAFSLAASIAFLVVLLYLDVFKFLLGPGYRSGLNIVPVLLLAYWFLGLYYNFSLWYKIKDKTYIGALISLGGAVVTFVVAASLIPQHGSIAMAWAGLACYGFMSLTSFITGYFFYPIPYALGKMLSYLFLALGLYGINELVKLYFSPLVLAQLLISTLLTIGYVGIIYQFDRKKIHSWIGLR